MSFNQYWCRGVKADIKADTEPDLKPGSKPDNEANARASVKADIKRTTPPPADARAFKPNATTTASVTGQPSIDTTLETLLSLLVDLNRKVLRLEGVVMRNAVREQLQHDTETLLA